MLELPTAEVMKELDQLMVALADESRSSLATMLVIGVLIGLAGLLAIWLISRRITRPLREMGVMLATIGQGEGYSTQRLNTDSRNDLGQIAAGFNDFLKDRQSVWTGKDGDKR